MGLTLTRANHVFHFDQWWNPSAAAQAEGRVDRIGQKKPVFVTSLFTADTIEQRIQDILTKKRILFNEVIDDLSDTKLTKVLTEEELFGLFDLQKPKRAGAPKPSPEEDVTIAALRQLSPPRFETLVAELYKRMGYQVMQTPATRDAGVDVYAKRISDSGTEYLAIQCKHSPDGKVGVDTARSLYGVIQAKQEVTKGVLITSGEFSSECRDFAAGKRLELCDRSYLLGLLQKYKVPIKEV
jgi:HJR/Mrr/RecB family endonuclease